MQIKMNNTQYISNKKQEREKKKMIHITFITDENHWKLFH